LGREGRGGATDQDGKARQATAKSQHEVSFLGKGEQATSREVLPVSTSSGPALELAAYERLSCDAVVRSGPAVEGVRSGPAVEVIRAVSPV